MAPWPSPVGGTGNQESRTGRYRAHGLDGPGHVIGKVGLVEHHDRRDAAFVREYEIAFKPGAGSGPGPGH